MIEITLHTTINHAHNYHPIYPYVVEIIFEYTYQSFTNKLSTISTHISILDCANIRIYICLYTTLLIFPMGNLSHFSLLLNTLKPYQTPIFQRCSICKRFP